MPLHLVAPMPAPRTLRLSYSPAEEDAHAHRSAFTLSSNTTGRTLFAIWSKNVSQGVNIKSSPCLVLIGVHFIINYFGYFLKQEWDRMLKKIVVSNVFLILWSISLCNRDPCPCQNLWIFWEILNALWPPSPRSFFGKNIAKFSEHYDQNSRWMSIKFAMWWDGGGQSSFHWK